MFGKILIAIILIVAVIMVVNNLPSFISYLKSSNFFKVDFTSLSKTYNGSSSSSNYSASKNYGLPFSLIPGYKVSPASPSSSASYGYTVTPQQNTQMQQSPVYNSSPQPVNTQPQYNPYPNSGSQSGPAQSPGY